MLDAVSPTTAANGLPWRFLSSGGFAWSEESSFLLPLARLLFFRDKSRDDGEVAAAVVVRDARENKGCTAWLENDNASTVFE